MDSRPTLIHYSDAELTKTTRTMAIKLQCSCGHAMSVPDHFAGKTGKCPKCQKGVKVPMAGGAATVGSSPAVSKAVASNPTAARGKPATTAAAMPLSGLDSLFDDVGLKQQTGPACPSCSKAYRPGAAICVHCGLNFTTGEKVAGFDAQSVRPEFDNLYLQEASDNMQRDLAVEKRVSNASMPWWIIMSYLIGAMTLCAAGVIIVDGIVAEPAPEGTFIGKLQRMPVLITLGMTAGITGIAIVLFAHLSICIFAFGRSALHGCGCFFLPLLYSVPYGIANWTDNKAPIKAIVTALIFIGSAIGLIIKGGGFSYVSNLF